MCTKEAFTARIAQGLAERRAEREAQEVERKERKELQYWCYARDKTDGHGKKRFGNAFFQS